MQRTPRIVVSALGAVALACSAGQGFADNGESLDINQPNYESIQSISVAPPSGIWPAPFVQVQSDGSVYTKAVGTSAQYALKAHVKTSKSKWRVRDLNWGIGAFVANSGGGTLNYVNHSYGSFSSQTGDAGNVEKFSQELGVDVPLASSGLGEFAVARCNATRRGLEQQGVSQIAIFNVDRNITIPVAFHFAARAAYKGETIVESGGPLVNPYWRQAAAWFNMPVRCLKAPALDLKTKTDPTPIPTGPEVLKLKIGVTQAALVIVPQEIKGVCPMQLNASATIVTNGATQVQYRFESDKGELSPVGSVWVDGASMTAFFNTKFTVGSAGAAGSAQNTLSAGQPGGGGASGITAPVGVAAQPGQPGVVQGFYRLHVLTPNTIESSPASFKVTCEQQISAAVPLAAVPAPPHRLDPPSPLPVRALPPAPAAAKDVFERSKPHIMSPPTRR